MFMSPSDERHRRDVWERLGWLWVVLFYTALLGSLLLSLSDEGLTRDERLAVIGLSAFFAGWQVVLMRLGWERLCDNPRLSMPLMLAAVVAWYLLVSIHDAFNFLLLGLFSSFYNWLRLRWAIVLSVVMTALIILARGQSMDLDVNDPVIWLIGAGTGIGILLGVWINAIIGQSVRRRELIEQLEESRAELAAAQRREGMMAERERLAREIHDTLSQGFTSIVMHLEAAEQALPDDLVTLQRHLDRARETARDSLQEARRVVHDLRPDLLARQSLFQALERVVQRWSEENGVQASVTTTGTVVPLPADVDVTLLRVTQEALANVARHAEAERVTLTLSYMNDVVVLDVQDNGVGLDGAAPSAGSGFGLTAMRERIEQLGGTLFVESEPGEGTTLVVDIPLAKGDD
jgi:signal transduction histidine kinase